MRFAKLKGRLSVLQHLHTPKPDTCESSCFLYRSSCRRTRSQLPETLTCECHMASLFNGTSSPCMLQTIEKIRPVNRKDDHHQVIDFYQNFCPACVPAVRHQDDIWVAAVGSKTSPEAKQIEELAGDAKYKDKARWLHLGQSGHLPFPDTPYFHRWKGGQAQRYDLNLQIDVVFTAHSQVKFMLVNLGSLEEAQKQLAQVTKSLSTQKFSNV